MNHAILILAHKNPEMLIPLVGYFKRDCMVYIHFDAASPFPASVQSVLRDYPQVKGIYQQCRVHWGGFSVLQAELFLLRAALSDGRADFYHLISGQDYPISNWSWESNYDLIYNMTDNNAEELFLDDSLDDGWSQYKFGFVFTTYLMEEYGKDTYHTFMSRASAKMEDVITSVDTVTLDETLKEVYGENIFEDFTAWYQVNMERFRLPE